MAEYIDREKLIPDRCYDEPYGYEAVSIDQIFHEEVADVVEREKIDKAIEEITKLRNSTDNMITEETTLVNECYKQYVNCFDECLKIIKRNI